MLIYEYLKTNEDNINMNVISSMHCQSMGRSVRCTIYFQSEAYFLSIYSSEK